MPKSEQHSRLVGRKTPQCRLLAVRHVKTIPFAVAVDGDAMIRPIANRDMNQVPRFCRFRWSRQILCSSEEFAACNPFHGLAFAINDGIKGFAVSIQLHGHDTTATLGK